MNHKLLTQSCVIKIGLFDDELIHCAREVSLLKLNERCEGVHSCQ